MSDIDTYALARLALWDKPFGAFFFDRRVVPGGFTNAEWTRLCMLVESVDAAAVRRFVLIQALVYAVVSTFAVGVTAGVLWLTARVFPMGTTAVLLIFPFMVALILAAAALSERIALPFAITEAMRANLTAQPGDAELVAKMKLPFGWIAAMFAGLMVAASAYGYFASRGSPIAVAMDWLALLFLAIAAIVVLVRWVRRPPTMGPPRV